MPSTHPTVQQRRAYREKPAPHFERVANVWSGLMGFHVSPEQVVLMLAVLKITREWYKHDEDNIEDAVGYLSLIEELQEFWGPQRAVAAPPAPIPPPPVI